MLRKQKYHISERFTNGVGLRSATNSSCAPVGLQRDFVVGALQWEGDGGATRAEEQKKEGGSGIEAMHGHEDGEMWKRENFRAKLSEGHYNGCRDRCVGTSRSSVCAELNFGRCGDFHTR